MSTPAELELNRETVEFLIDKAQEFHVKEAVTIPEEQSLSPSDDWARQVLAAHADDPTYQELKTTIEDLEPDQQISLVALMWLGRGDYTLDEWNDALQHAEASWNDHTADYLIGTPLLADYLAEGLEQFAAQVDQED
ncbi:MAG: DUF3775 domain-containing protein [Gammaproteobacteria bacterium]|nr:MAG: DUF3775 domain-containing protein [Gammaproteobacteria bacterium]